MRFSRQESIERSRSPKTGPRLQRAAPAGVNPRARRRPVPPSGFTLVEVLIVVLMMAIVAAVALPKYQNSSREGEQRAFITQLQAFAQAARRYMHETGEYLEDSGTGQIPTGWEPLIDERVWTSPTPIGGLWDVELDAFEVRSALGVHFYGASGPRRDDAYMIEIDRMFDDGSLTTGRFRKIAPDRYYFILED